MKRLKERVAIITGGASGIGEAAVRLFIQEGASVVLADIHEQRGSCIAQQLQEAGGEIFFHLTDVTQEESVMHLMRTTWERFKKMDILFNNAGIDIARPVTETPLEEFQRHIDINLKGVFLGCKHGIPYLMDSGGGSIINTASILAHLASPNQAAYSASKGGVIALSRQMAYDYARYHIRVNCISPADTETPMHRKWLQETEDPEATRAKFTKRYPLGRFAKPQEQAAAALFLASDDSSFITGQTILVDGGMSIC